MAGLVGLGEDLGMVGDALTGIVDIWNLRSHIQVSPEKKLIFDHITSRRTSRPNHIFVSQPQGTLGVLL